MNDNERFERLWNDYLEGELQDGGIADLQQLLASDDSLLRAAADSFQVHRLLGLKAKDSEIRHEDFVRSTMERLPSGETEFVGDVMKMLPVRGTGKPFSHLLFRGVVAATLLLLVTLLVFRTSSSPEGARVTQLHGAIEWTGEGGVVHDLHKAGLVLRGGTMESQSADAWAELTFHDGTTVTVSGRSLLTFSEQKQKIVHLRYGNISANVAPQPTGRPMLILTPSAQMNVLGTQFNVDAQSDSTRLVVNEGRVRLKRNTDGKEVEVDAQHSVTASINKQDDLVPMQRAEAISGWKSDLESDVVYGKWVSRLWSLGANLKKAVASGEMTEDAAIKAYKQAAHFDDSTGSVWTAPSPAGSLIILSPRRSTQQPVLLNANTKVIVRGRSHTQVAVEIGLSVGHPDGGFAGKYSTHIPVSQLADGEDFELELPISKFRDETNPDGSPIGSELTGWWFVAEASAAKFEITGVELTDISERGKR